MPVFIMGAVLLCAVLLYLALGTQAKTPIASNSTLYSTESRRAVQNGYNVNSSTFSCDTSNQCVKVQVTRCGNNEPSQYICINSGSRQNFENQAQKIRNSEGPVACPQFYMEGNISCGCASSYCNESFSR